MNTEHNAPRNGSSPGYETRDVDTHFIHIVVWLLVVLTLGGLGVSWYVVRIMSDREMRNPPVVSPLAQSLPEQPPEPRLQNIPAADLQKVRMTEQGILHNYAWIDEKSGIVRIPIDRAMDLVAERGLPVRSKEPGVRARPAEGEVRK
jgi:hypothetical protein